MIDFRKPPVALTLLFIVLKLTGHVDWSWWWITAPLWGGQLLAIALLVLRYALETPKERALRELLEKLHP